ncbi:recombination protein O N-terminal domain-containing protein [Sulfurihydrogenibium subterraneum]|uniref:recombination protein O N-terminal domain-containing protein n=1 Tax=Sulfurihydrogenibium subterraneum TaxID=171121 RepID=UPI00048CD54A|nr:recombination protein O N-terminal domain-containing protein [Sulfurihydrogenibium subterraneum]
MYTLFKDQAIVLKRTFVGEKDLSLTVYTKKLGKESIFIQNGQLIKNLPIVSLTEFNWFSGVFFKIKDKLYINEIDNFKNVAIEIVKDYNRFLSAYNVISWIYSFAPHQDEKIFILLKKTLYYLTLTNDTDLLELSFLVRLMYLNGELNLNIIDLENQEKELLIHLLKTPISQISSISNKENINLQKIKEKLLSFAHSL